MAKITTRLLFMDLIREKDAIGKYNEFKFQIPVLIEHQMLDEITGGDRSLMGGWSRGVRDAVIWKGVRAAFPKLYGFDVEWDAEKMDLVRKVVQ